MEKVLLQQVPLSEVHLLIRIVRIQHLCETNNVYINIIISMTVPAVVQERRKYTQVKCLPRILHIIINPGYTCMYTFRSKIMQMYEVDSSNTMYIHVHVHLECHSEKGNFRNVHEILDKTLLSRWKSLFHAGQLSKTHF